MAHGDSVVRPLASPLSRCRARRVTSSLWSGGAQSGFLGVAPPLWQFLARGGDVAAFLQHSPEKLRKKRRVERGKLRQKYEFLFLVVVKIFISILSVACFWLPLRRLIIILLYLWF